VKKLLKIPAVILIGFAFYTWITYDEYISTTETLFPWLNFPGIFKQTFNWLFVCIQWALGAFLWHLSGDKKEI
jgi:hypothetical protein